MAAALVEALGLKTKMLASSNAHIISSTAACQLDACVLITLVKAIITKAPKLPTHRIKLAIMPDCSMLTWFSASANNMGSPGKKMKPVATAININVLRGKDWQSG